MDAQTVHEVQRHFGIVDKDGSGLLNKASFAQLIERLGRRLDIEHVFNMITHGSSTLPYSDFSDFAREKQHMDMSEASLKQLYDRYADGGRDQMTLAGFSAFLQSAENAIVGENRGSMALTRPLTEYFISSSHNVRHSLPLGGLAHVVTDLSPWQPIH